MGEIPRTNNPALGEAERLINAGILKAGSPALIQLITSIPALSFLKIWPLSVIFSYLLNHFLMGPLSVLFQQMGVSLILTFQTDEERGAYSKAEGELRIALEKGDLNAIEQAKKASDQAIDNAIHYDGSSPLIR